MCYQHQRNLPTISLCHHFMPIRRIHHGKGATGWRSNHHSLASSEHLGLACPGTACHSALVDALLVCGTSSERLKSQLYAWCQRICRIVPTLGTQVGDMLPHIKPRILFEDFPCYSKKSTVVDITSSPISIFQYAAIEFYERFWRLFSSEVRPRRVPIGIARIMDIL